MLGNYAPDHLRLAVMTKEDEWLVHRRRGWWVRVAREQKEIKMAALAEALGYTDGEGTISLWERGLRPIPSGKFPAIAAILDLPDRYLVNPPETDEERLVDAVRRGIEQARRESEPGQEQGPADDGPPSGRPKRRGR